jgi:hypothetical protein
MKYLLFVLLVLSFPLTGFQHSYDLDNYITTDEELFSEEIFNDSEEDHIQYKAKYKWQFAVVSIFQNEAAYLKEWIEFHMLVGAEHFILYNNLSTDDYMSVLAPYVKKGIVEVIDWPYDHTNTAEFDALATNAFHDGLTRAKGKAVWLAILDTDEFLYVVDGRKIQDYLKALLKTKIGGVLVHWYMFGTSYVPKIPDDKLMIEVLVRSGGRHELFKTICRPDCVSNVANQHYCIYIKPYAVHKTIENALGDIRIKKEVS